MGEIDKKKAIEILTKDNPLARADEIAIYTDSFIDYCEAENNIRANGNIVSHPRTGSPIENPYIKIKSIASASMQRIKKIKKVTRLWQLNRT